MEEIQRKSWFRRNWLWFVPSMGCLTIIVLIAVGVFSVFSMINDFEPTQFALEEASTNSIVIEALGEPIEKNGITSGNFSFRNGEGNADFSMPIRGPKGEGTLRVVAEQKDDEWTYETLYVIIKASKERINLLDKKLDDPQ